MPALINFILIDGQMAGQSTDIRSQQTIALFTEANLESYELVN